MMTLKLFRGIFGSFGPIRALFAAGCASGGGVSVATNPKTYLADYPIGEPQQAVFGRMGAPNNQSSRSTTGRS